MLLKCHTCGNETGVGIEELYLLALIKETGLEVVNITCSDCPDSSESYYTYEECLRILEIISDKRGGQ